MDGGTPDTQVDHIHPVSHRRIDGRDHRRTGGCGVSSRCSKNLVVAQKSPGGDPAHRCQGRVHRRSRCSARHPRPVPDLVSGSLVTLDIQPELGLHEGASDNHLVGGKPLGLRNGEPLRRDQVGILKHHVILVDAGVNESDPDSQPRLLTAADLLPGHGRPHQGGSGVHE